MTKTDEAVAITRLSAMSDSHGASRRMPATPITPELHDALYALAEKRGTQMTVLLRVAVATYIVQQAGDSLVSIK